MNPHLLETPKLHVTSVDGWPDFGALLERLAPRRGLVALESAAGEPCDWSWIAFEPDLSRPELPARLEELRDWLASSSPLAPPADSAGASIPGPFAGGFIGALAYDRGVVGDPLDLPADPWDSPSIVGGDYSRFFVFDHRARRVHLVLDAAASGAQRDELLEHARAASADSRSVVDFGTCGDLKRLVSPAEHRARIEAAREQIAAGEIYQANLAHPFEARTEGDPLQLFLRLRHVNPAPYMAFLRWDDSRTGKQGALISASPELLLECDGRRLRTRPIKGTAPRSQDPREDARLGAELLASEKDRAELAMIVDLMRNDLGRVAEVGSVRVSEFPMLRSYAGVHHLLADVEARLAPNRDALDALASAFPGGSVTGAPKLRAMEIIGALEGEGRGFFTGSLGFLDRRGHACFNILIRTMQWRPEAWRGDRAGRVRYHVGGGITWSSDARAEDRETLIKGAKLAASLGHEVERRTR